MDRNQATGLILFAAVLLVYSIFFASSPEPITTEDPTTNQELVIKKEAEPALETLQAEPDSIQDIISQRQFGAFAAFTKGQQEDVVLENEKMAITFSTKGAEISKVVLKEFKTWDQRPLTILDENSSDLNYNIQTDKGLLSLNEFYFNSTLSTIDIEGVNASVLTFIAQSGSGQIVRTYTLPDNQYILNKSLEFKGLSGNLTDSNIQITWEDKLLKQEADLEESRRKTNINFYKFSP